MYSNIADTSEATKNSSSPKPNTNGDPLLTATSFCSSACNTTNPNVPSAHSTA